MDYERIHKPQCGFISPSKIRMKLMGPQHSKKDTSPSISPSKREDLDFAKNGLLTLTVEDFLNAPTHPTKSSKNESGNSNAIHPLRPAEDDNLDYDSNASSSSFEFHKERAAQSQLTRSLSRPMSSKWNDAEKWIMSKPNHSKKSTHSKNMGAGQDPKPYRSSDKFSFLPNDSSLFKDLREPPEEGQGFKSTEVSGMSTVRSVCMRDMGTEMTPATSVEPSRSTTPVGASTPLRSLSSSPSTTPPRKSLELVSEYSERALTEEEQKQKTRREIVALGKQLGKLNIAEWASKEEDDSKVNARSLVSLERMESEKKAAVWEEAERSKFAARHKRDEIMIQAWESQQKAKLEAELRKIEAKVEQMHAQAQAKMVKKISMARQKSEEKRAAAEARKNRDAEKAADQAEYIRQTGKLPPTRSGFCCGLWPSM